MSAENPVTLETGATDGQRLRISFLWHDDRIAHTVGAWDGLRLFPALASHEGNADELWPASPVFQDVQLDRSTGGAQTALLVGMAGSSHWSAGIEVNVASARIDFDVACRVKSEPTRLSSTYRSMTAAARIDEQELLIEISKHPLRLQIEPIGKVQSRLRTTDLGLCVEAALVAATCPRTIRWKYSISTRKRSKHELKGT